MPSKTDTRMGRRENERGAAVVEFAVIALLLLTIIFGILEFALIFMQGHYVENGAREGVRVGVRANNYTKFATDDSACSAVHKCNRTKAIEQKVTDYLDTFYAAPGITVTRQENDGQPVLSVKVEAANFLPPLLSALVPGYTAPVTFTYTATGFYEDPDEYADEN